MKLKTATELKKRILREQLVKYNKEKFKNSLKEITMSQKK